MSLLDRITEEWINRGILEPMHYGTPNLPELTPEQKAQISAQTQFFTGTVAPTYQNAVLGATDVYNQNLPGVTNAAQNLAGTASQAGQTLGETGSVGATG